MERIEAFNCLIRAYFCQSQYKAVILIGKSIFYDVNKYGKRNQKEKFFGNMANAYFNEGMYSEAGHMLKYINNYSSKTIELYFLTLKAAVKSKLDILDEAVVIYKDIINKSLDINDYNYLVNSYSNIGDIYLYKDINIAKEYIEKAITLINNCSNIKYNLNCYYNKFLLEIQLKNDITNIEYWFNVSMKYAVETNDCRYQDKLVLNLMHSYISYNMEDAILEKLSMIKHEYNYIANNNVIIECAKHVNSSKLSYDIIKLAQKL